MYVYDFHAWRVFSPWLLRHPSNITIIVIIWSKYVAEFWIHSIGSNLLMEAGKILILSFYCIIFIVITIIVSQGYTGTDSELDCVYIQVRDDGTLLLYFSALCLSAYCTHIT